MTVSMPSLIPHKEYGHRIDWGQTYSMPINSSLQLMFAYDIVFMTRNHQDAQEIITCFLKSAVAFQLKMNFK